MKRVMCYGDSLTWGFDPASGMRFGPDQRWTALLAAAMPGITVIEEGLNGRTAGCDDPDALSDRNGLHMLHSLLDSHQPLDAVILMLGVNDTKLGFNQSPYDIQKSMAGLIHIAQDPACYRHTHHQLPKVLVVAPVAIGAGIKDNHPFPGIDMSSYRKSIALPKLYAQLAADHGCCYLDANDYVQACTIDNLHMDAAGHQMMAAALQEKLTEMFKEEGL